MLGRLIRRLRSLVRSSELRRELDEEMGFHLDALTDDLVREGMSLDDARREALRRFGNPERVQERARDERGLGVVDETARNVRFAGRFLVRSPLYAGTFILTLALCVAASAAVFSVADAVLWRGLPYPSPERLAHVVAYDPATGKSPGSTATDGRTWELVRDRGAPLESTVYSGWARGVNLTTDASAAFVMQQRVGAGYFATLGVPAALGREFTRAEDVPGGASVAVLSRDLWERAFGADRSILGRTIRLKGEEHTVVGVLPSGFRSPSGADVFTPLRPSTTGEGADANYAVLVRIPEGMSVAEADERLAGIDLARPGTEDGRRLGLVPLDAALNAGARTPLTVLLAGVILMLVVGVSNLAGLQIARALGRGTEFATRSALGGGAGALVRQVLAENALLGALGGVTGLVIAASTLGTVERLVGSHFGIWQEVRLDLRVILAAGGITLLATAAFGLAPVGQVLRGRLAPALRSGTRTLGGGAHALRKALVVGQVAMVTAMLFAAGLLVRSYGYLEGLDPGFDPERVLTVQLSLEDARYADAERVHRLFDESLAGLRALPGVTSAGVALTLPYERPLNLPYRVPGDEWGPVANAVYVTPDFFETLGIPVLTGRAFQDSDREDSPPVAVVNRAFVDRVFAGEDPVGRSLEIGFGVDALAVVGVVGNVQQTASWGGDGQPVWETPTVYVSAAQMSSATFRGVHVWFSPSWVVRTDRADPTMAAAVSRALLRAAPDMPTARVAWLGDVMDEAFAAQRFEAAFLLAVAAFSLLLAGIGLYGIVAHEVLERRREMGLRMALGANPSQAVWSAAAPGLGLALTGVAVGGGASILLAGAMRGLVFGITPADPWVAAGILGVMALLALVASLVPATRAGRFDPARVMREV